MIAVKRIAIALVLAFVVIVFGLFGYNFYLRSLATSDPDAKPPVIYERSDRPSRA